MGHRRTQRPRAAAQRAERRAVPHPLHARRMNPALTVVCGLKGDPMAYYRLYFFNLGNGHIDHFHEFEAPTDMAAIVHAGELRDLAERQIGQNRADKPEFH